MYESLLRILEIASGLILGQVLWNYICEKLSDDEV